MTNPVCATPTNPTQPDPRVVALLGLDDHGKPHGAAFGADDAELARKAASLGGMHVLDLGDNDELCSLADKLPAGRIFASGAAFAPFVARALFNRLCSVGGVTPDMLAKLRAASAPIPGSALVEAAPPPHLPADWDAIIVGSLVLATEGGGEGWWEATVIRLAEDDGVAVLHWRDWPDIEPFARHRNQLALLPQAASAA